MLVLEKKDHIPLPPLVEVDSKLTQVTDLAVVELSQADSHRSCNFWSWLATSQVVATLVCILTSVLSLPVEKSGTKW